MTVIVDDILAFCIKRYNLNHLQWHIKQAKLSKSRKCDSIISKLFKVNALWKVCEMHVYYLMKKTSFLHNSGTGRWYTNSCLFKWRHSSRLSVSNGWNGHSLGFYSAMTASWDNCVHRMRFLTLFILEKKHPKYANFCHTQLNCLATCEAV